ncbi:FG-GAP repeat domain-containing protein [Dysgonomonas sp. ZJ279]|uniref:FG-GAP repeat domain-containing protein n=1 Tax=Dysgonomonas sp. ZJ279 TaxID=2709796 RepID=UPI0013EDA367|nr:VCBS repeat-containing protein [Dysgonomonas sp. ZJ279]
MKIKIFIISCLLSFPLFLLGQPLMLAPQNTKDSGIYPPGYVNPDNWSFTCFDYMGSVKFTSAYRFYSPTNGTAAANPRSYGFSIPLVADLNGDGYPEIITSRTYADGSIYGWHQGLLIYNGQTGELISNLEYPGLTAGAYFFNYDYHTSPSIMALVDSDRDGTVEVVIAFPSRNIGAGLAQYTSSLMSFNLVYNAVSKTYSLQQKWKANNYNSGATNIHLYGKTIPQIVDIEGDGVPEVLVQNKIYNAKTGALLIALETLGSTAYTGADAKATTGALTDGGDTNIPFSYIYDIDLDGNYEVIAGGKIYYDLNLASGTYKILQMPGVGDGRTGIADIDGDGIADVVVVNRVSSTQIKIVVWNPNFWIINPSDGKTIIKNPAATPVPTILAQLTFDIDTNATAQGNNSYVYIGDIDGREQTVGGKKYRLPEIAILSGRIRGSQLVQHPNISGLGFPTSTTVSAGQGVLIGFTFDPAETNVQNKLKTSFVLEHNDRSINTGFTMFDFDNDGMQEICYRDEATLRIIKAGVQPYVPLSYTETSNPNVILFSKPVISFTGFEYPVIADIDNDSSAEMVVIGRNQLGSDYAFGFPFAVGTNGDKFAPALSVWNQFMYDPFKINEDMTTPIGKAINRLKGEYEFTKVVRDANGTITKVIENYNPYNCTLGQLPKFMTNQGEYNGTIYDNMFEPIIFLTEAYLINEKDTDVNKRPKIVTISNKLYIQVYVGNKSTAQTDISSNTPISVYNDKIGGATFLKKVTLKDCGLSASAIRAGEEVLINIPIEDEFGSYIFRLSDDSDFSNISNISWHFGTNEAGMNDQTNFTGTATRAFRDCDWSDQIARASKFKLNDDALTLQEYGTITTNILSNDILPLDFVATFSSAIITAAPTSGTLKFTGSNLTGNIIYTHTGTAPLANGIDKFTYQLSYKSTGGATKILTANVYIFILQSDLGGFAACYNEDYTAALKNAPSGVEYSWYEVDGTTEVGTNPQQSIVISNITTTMNYKIKPVIPTNYVEYSELSFPQGDLSIKTVTGSEGDVKKLQWTGKISSDWYNPANWVDDSNVEATFAPTGCVDAIIPMVTTNYPSLNKDSRVSQLSLKDRAMIANAHKLTYNGVDIELILKNVEQNKWMVLSAPLRKTYAGDYLPMDADNNQIKKAMYMSYYEKMNPDNPASTAENSTLTRPFGKIESDLPLGQGFMLYADRKYAENPRLLFPSGTNQYTYNMHNALGMQPRTQASETLSRVDGSTDVSKGRFIFEAATDLNATDGSFTVTYSGTYILVVNPFPTSFNIKKFLEVNSSVLAQEYKIWSGTSDSFIGLVNGNEGTTWKIKDGATFTPIGSTDVYAAPFQSFFVKTLGSSSVNLKYEPETMTKGQATNFSY